MTEIMPVPRNLNFTVLPAESFRAASFFVSRKLCIRDVAETAEKAALPLGAAVRAVLGTAFAAGLRAGFGLLWLSLPGLILLRFILILYAHCLRLL